MGLLDRPSLDNADVVGWKDGGGVALDRAIGHSARVRKFTAITANFDPDGQIGRAEPTVRQRRMRGIGPCSTGTSRRCGEPSRVARRMN